MDNSTLQNGTAKPQVTVGIITRNRKEYLQQAIESALAQGDYVDEVLIVDDASEDETEELVRNYLDPKISYIRLEQQSGRPAARNKVVEHMKGSFLVWLDDDDVLMHHSVESQLSVLDRHPDAEIVYGNLAICDENLIFREELRYKQFAQDNLLVCLIFENEIPNGGTLIRKSVFEKVGEYDSRFHRAQDYQFWARAAAKKCKFYHNNSLVYKYRFHDTNVNSPEEIRDQSKYGCMVIETILAEAPIEEVFTEYDWIGDAELAMHYAMMMCMRAFFDRGDDQSAMDCLKIAESYRETPNSRISRAYLVRALGRFEESADLFAEFIFRIPL